MPVKFTDCYIVSTDVKHDAYRAKNPNSTQGLEDDRVKIKHTEVKDCKRVNIQNEEQEQEDELEVLTDGEQEEEGKPEEPTMKDLMEGFRRFAEG